MSEISFESQLSFLSQPSQLGDITLSSQSQHDNSIDSPQKGWVNEHYTKSIVDGRKIRTCMAEGCHKQYAAGSSTMVFKLHWTKDHSEQTDLKKTKYLFHDQIHTNRLIKAVIDLHWDFSVVDKPSFRKLLHTFNCNKNIICRKTLSSLISSNRRHLATKVTEKLRCAESVALTFDIWSVRKGARGFGCITAHYINTHGQLANLILNFERMKFPHNAETICKMISKTIVANKLEGRVVSITTDNASNNIAAIRQLAASMNLSPLNIDFVHYKCVAHIIDLGIKAAMKDLREVVRPVREAVMAIRSSRKRKEMFIDKQKALIECGEQTTKDTLELAEDVDHRWNSALILIERAFCLQKAIDYMIQSSKGMECLDKIDWLTLEMIIQFLKPFHEATKRVCVGSDVTISLVSFIIPKLVDHCVKFEGSPNDSISKSAKSLRNKLTDYECELYHAIINLAYVLDPRFKTKNLSEEITKIVRNQLKKLLDETQAPSLDIAATIEDSVLCDQSDDEEPIDELENYLTTRRERSKSDALIWWRNNAELYPKLSTIARKVLPIQATSVASERVFSVAGDIDTKSRNRLSDESVENLVLYKSWIQFLNIE